MSPVPALEMDAASELALRAPLYSFLSRLLVREIDADLWVELAAEPQRAIWVRLAPELADPLAAPLDADAEEALREEFTRLFLLPGGVSPFAHHWLDGESIANGVTQSLAALGLEPVQDEPWGRLPLDHVSLLLELVATAAESDDTRALGVSLEHAWLAPWLPEFGSLLEAEAREPIYQALGRMVMSLAL